MNKEETLSPYAITLLSALIMGIIFGIFSLIVQGIYDEGFREGEVRGHNFVLSQIAHNTGCDKEITIGLLDGTEYKYKRICPEPIFNLNPNWTVHFSKPLSNTLNVNWTKPDDQIKIVSPNGTIIKYFDRENTLQRYKDMMNSYQGALGFLE